MNLTGHTILITGGTSGIGLELAKVLLQKQNVVIITGRSAERLAATKKLFPQIHTYLSDVSKPEDIAALREQVLRDFPRLNILINNAGIMVELNLHLTNLSDEKLTGEIATNLLGPIRMTHAFLAHLSKQTSAAIINVTSGLAFVPLPTAPVYSATKAGLHSFTQSLRVQFQGTALKIFEIAPPATVTPLLDGHNAEDMKTIPLMSVEDMVKKSISGIEKGAYEVRPGAANQLRLMSRIAPDFILKQLSRPVKRMLAANRA